MGRQLTLDEIIRDCENDKDTKTSTEREGVVEKVSR